MKVVALNGSPRLRGNTYLLLEKALEPIAAQGIETEIINLADKRLSPCTGCYGCIKAKKCVVEDDFQEIYAKVIAADGLIFGSPVYHSCITPYIKSFMDRAGFSARWQGSSMQDKDKAYDWALSPFSGKIVAPVTVARRAGQNFAFAELLLWFAANDMIIVGNTYWNMAVAGKGGSIGIDEDLEGLGIMTNLGQRMARLIQQLRA